MDRANPSSHTRKIAFVQDFALDRRPSFGEMSLLTGQPRSAIMTTTTDCELLGFDRVVFTYILAVREDMPQVLSDLAARAAKNAEFMEHLKVSSVVSPDLVRDGILLRLKLMLGNWRGK
jgi:hypothetical protein